VAALRNAQQEESPPSTPNSVQCEGVYPQHLQGVCSDGQDALYWSFTSVVHAATDPTKGLVVTSNQP
jgi:hypothetical protein